MIYSSLSAQAASCGLPPLFQKALDFLRNNDLDALALGRHEIDGDDLFALVQTQTTGTPAEKRCEAHYTYIDLQYLISGEERQGYALLTGTEQGEAHPERDVVFFEAPAGENFVTLRPGDFTLYFTNDAHRPNCAVTEAQTIKKVVLKLRETAFLAGCAGHNA